jgi:hypothetical protein
MSSLLLRDCGTGVRDVAAYRPVGKGPLPQILGGLPLGVEMVGRGMISWPQTRALQSVASSVQPVGVADGWRCP